VDEPALSDGGESLDIDSDIDAEVEALGATSPEERRGDSDQMDSTEPEPHTVEELEQSTIGNALRGARAHTRDDEVHGERLFDRPDT
jgi:hypothetical protein